MAIAQVLEVSHETDTAPSPVIDLSSRRPAHHGGWLSRCVATLAYLATLAGLIAVATLGGNNGAAPTPGPVPARVVVSSPGVVDTP